MEKRSLLCGLAMLMAIASTAFPRPDSYSLGIKKITREQKVVPKNPIFVGPWVGKPGAYRFKNGMTVADAIKMAGGVTDYPTRIIVRRPTKEDPDPEMWGSAIYSCELDRSKSDAGVSSCSFPLKSRDFVEPIKPPKGPII